MNNERCEFYKEETGDCGYPKDFQPTRCKLGKCETKGLGDGCNKAHLIIPPEDGKLHLLLTPGSNAVTVWVYPVPRS